jgi:hypothetical protein
MDPEAHTRSDRDTGDGGFARDRVVAGKAQ